MSNEVNLIRMDGNDGNTVAEPFSAHGEGRLNDLPSMATVEAVASALDVDPATLPPLYDVVDPDALDDLVSDWTRDDVRVSFSYADCDVTVTSGSVTVEPRAKSESAHPE